MTRGGQRGPRWGWLLALMGLLFLGNTSGQWHLTPSSSAPAGPACEDGPAGSPARAVPRCGEVEAVGRVRARQIRECSGLAHSRRQPVLWLHNDSGDKARFFGIDTSGVLLATVRLAGVKAVDWEDMAAGPLPGGGEGLFLGDIGDNLRNRRQVTVYRVPEPLLRPDAGVLDTTVTEFDRLDLTYPDGPRNAETLLVDPRSGTVYVLTKDASGLSDLFRAPWGPGSDRKQLEHVLRLTVGVDPLHGSPSITAGDIDAAGRRAVLLTYNRVFMFTARASVSPELLLDRVPVSVPVPWVRGGEAIALTPDGSRYYVLSEGRNEVLYRVTCW